MLFDGREKLIPAKKKEKKFCRIFKLGKQTQLMSRTFSKIDVAYHGKVSFSGCISACTVYFLAISYMAWLEGKGFNLKALVSNIKRASPSWVNICTGGDHVMGTL